MAHTLQISALGPHDDLRLPIPRHAVIRGPSQSGKSTVLAAVCALLGGTAPDGGAFPAALIRDGEEAAVIEWGPMRRRLSRTGSKRGRVGETTANSARAWGAALGHVGEHWGTIGRHIVAPMSWAVLMYSTRARGLSALLRAVLPQVDLRAMAAEEMATHGGLRDGDPMEIRGRGGALELQQEANSAADRATGAASQAAAHLARVNTPPNDAPEEPPAERVEKARQYLALCAEWQAHDDAVAAWEREKRAGESGRDALAKWAAAVDAMGAQPADPGEEPQGRASVALSGLRDRLAAAGEGLRRDAAQAAEAAAAEWKALRAWEQTEPETECGACGQALPTAEAAAAAWQARGDALRAAQAAAESRLSDAKKAQEAHPSPEDRAALEIAQAAADAEAEAGREWRAQMGARKLWAAKRRTLEQSKPAAPAPLRGAPEAPAQARPPAQYSEQAQALVSAADEHGAAVQRWQAAEDSRKRATQQAREALEAAQLAAAEAQAEAARVQALVGVLRSIPGRAAASQAGHLAAALDGTGVSVEWADPDATTGPEVSVSVDGRPWVCASDGRKVMADLALRLALRRLASERYADAAPLGYASLPVIVDRAQAWSGGWPPAHLLGGPVWRLETVRGLSAVEVAPW